MTKTLQEKIDQILQEDEPWFDAVWVLCTAEKFDEARTLAETAPESIQKSLLDLITFRSENFCLPAEYWKNGIK